MTDNELLLAMSNLMDPLTEGMRDIKKDVRGINQGVSGLGQEFNGLKQEVKGLKQDVDGLKQEVKGLKQDVDGLKQEVKGLKQDVDGLKQDVKGLQQNVEELDIRVRSIELTQKNEILPRLNTIEACYTSTYERYRDKADAYEAMQQDVLILKKVVAGHSEKFQKIG